MGQRRFAKPPQSRSPVGYTDPMDVACQQARMILLGRRARYEAETRVLASKWGCTLAEMRVRYQAHHQENFEADEDYLQWQWYADALRSFPENNPSIKKTESNY